MTESLAKTNILEFPKIHPREAPDMPQSLDEAIRVLEDTKRLFNEEAKDVILHHIYDDLRMFGYMTDPRRVNSKDMMLLELALDGIMCRYYGLSHDIHDVAEAVIDISDGEDDDEEPTEE